MEFFVLSLPSGCLLPDVCGCWCPLCWAASSPADTSPRTAQVGTAPQDSSCSSGSSRCQLRPLRPRWFPIAGDGDGRCEQSSTRMGVTARGRGDGFQGRFSDLQCCHIQTSSGQGKGRGGRSSLRSQWYTRGSTATTAEPAPPQLCPCQDHEPSLNLAKPPGGGPGQDKRGSCSAITSPPPPQWPQNHGAEPWTCSPQHPLPQGPFALARPCSISFSPRTFPRRCLSVPEVGRCARRVKELVVGAGACCSRQVWCRLCNLIFLG